MSKIYERIAFLCERDGISGYKLCKDIGIQPSILTDLKMGRQSGLSAKNADKVSKYFNVPMSYLLGDTDNPNDRSKTHWAEVVNDGEEYDLARAKAAFFRGMDVAKERMDTAWEDAREYIAFKESQRRKKNGG